MEDISKTTVNDGNFDTNDGSSFLKKCLSEEEIKSVPESILIKIRNSLHESFEDFFTNKALYETLKQRHGKF